MYSTNDEVEKILNKVGKIKISDITPEQLEKGREILSQMDLSKIVVNGKAIKFEDIDNPIQLVQFLNSKAKINSLSEQYVSHYTSFDAARKILSNRRFYLANPACMNDGLEFYSKSMDCSKMYFASFSLENTENIGMWSMYGQPWEDGIKISIPKKLFIRWPDYIHRIYHINETSYETLLENPLTDDMFKLSVSRVAYVEWNKEREVSRIRCGEKAENKALKDVECQILSGYIKDVAWSYEKELRLRIDLNGALNEKRMAVDIPDDIYRQIIITTGPRFNHKENDLKTLGEHEIVSSIFTGKLNYVYCDKCSRRNKG